MKALIILNDGPYGTERSYNGLRLALAISSVDDASVRVYLMADAIACAKPGQVTPDGYYNIGRMLKSLAKRGAQIGACGSCMDARGIGESELSEGAQRSSIDELTAWTLEADKVIVF